MTWLGAREHFPKEGVKAQKIIPQRLAELKNTLGIKVPFNLVLLLLPHR